MTLPKKWRRVSDGMDYRALKRKSPIRRNWEQVGKGMVRIPVVYVNKRTGEVRYDKPKSEDELAQSIPNGIFNTEYYHRLGTQEHGPPETLPEDWEQHENQEEVLAVWFKDTNPGHKPTSVCYDPPLKHQIVVKTLSNAAITREGIRRGLDDKGLVLTESRPLRRVGKKNRLPFL